MTKTSKSRSTYSREFKLEAIRLMKESDRPSAEVTNEIETKRGR